MPSLRIKLFILGACAIAASMAVTATSRAQQSPENKAGSCVWKTLDSEAMLNQRIGRVDVANASLVRDFVPLLLKRGVPLSFIEADKDSRVTLSIGDPTLREVLEGIVSQSPGYGVRYWQVLRLISPVKLLSMGEEAQLRVVGDLPDGSSVDLTAAACGTRYSTSDEKLLVVTPDGVIESRAKGAAWVRIENGNQVDVLNIEVTASEARAAALRGKVQ